jgi:hypothetical protein
MWKLKDSIGMKSQLCRFAALENLNDKVNINRACESTAENIEMSAKERLREAYAILS